MIGTIDLPTDYRPLHRLVLCGNTLIDVLVPFDVEGSAPLLIGQGDGLQIWLYARPNRSGGPWIPLVRRNRSMHKDVQISGLGTSTLSVVWEKTTVISIEQRDHENYEVTDLDLRPLGLDVHGDSRVLIVGKSRLSRNTFRNLYAMVGIGSDPK